MSLFLLGHNLWGELKGFIQNISVLGLFSYGLCHIGKNVIMWLGIIMFTPLCTLKMLISLITVGVCSMMVVLILTLCFTVHYYQYNFTGTNYHIQHCNHWTEFVTFVSYYLD